MLPPDLSHAERSAARWARALYLAAYGTPPEDLSTTPADPLPDERFQLIAYPGLRHQPLTVALSGLERDRDDASNLLAFAARFERTLRLATAPLPARREPDEEPLPTASATATARGAAGLLTLREHDPLRPALQLPWLEGDPIELHIPLPPEAAAGLLIPSLPLDATLLSLNDGLRVTVALTPSKAALQARLKGDAPTDNHPAAVWEGIVSTSLPPLQLELNLRDPGRLSHLPFAAACWVASADRFALRISNHR